MITRKVGAAIAAGNTVVCKPAPETPLCAIALAKLFERAGGPPGVLNIITTSSERTPGVGKELCDNKLIKHLTFTGSTAVGRYLNAECAKTFKKTSMELGGNAPFLVFEDANISNAVDGEFPACPAIHHGGQKIEKLTTSKIGLISSKFRSSGQTCVCANRIFVHSSIIAKFSTLLYARLGEVFHYGSVWDSKVNFGPLYSPKALQKLSGQFQDAVTHGASIARDDLTKAQSTYGPNFYPPTVVTLNGKQNPKEMLFMREETFGPLAFLVPFDTEDEVVALANDTDAGLAAYFYTEDISRLYRVSEALETGMVGVRVGLISACEQPFGGVKESGFGREGGKGALEEYLNVKSITVGI
jgi:succinate-semialdehyde dehydrogenase/glutarate-semialdehyde dehydrogenase